MAIKDIEISSQAARDRVVISLHDFQDPAPRLGAAAKRPQPNALAVFFGPLIRTFRFLAAVPARSRDRADMRMRKHLAWSQPAETDWPPRRR